MTRQLKRFIETFRGSSFPTRSETTEGETCVVKLRGAGNGAASLLSEFVVNRLAHAAGLLVPNAFVVNISLGFPWDFGTDEFHDLVQKSPGPNLALEWIDGATPVSPKRYNAMSDDLVSQIVTLDLVFANRDRTARSGNLLEDRHQSCWIVDHGGCRFLFQQNFSPGPILPDDHIFFGWEETFDPAWLKPITPDSVSEIVAEIPEVWLAETQLMREAITKTVGTGLQTARLAHIDQSGGR
jgi:hypothetical protein